MAYQTKMPVGWHKNNLKNVRKYATRRKQELERRQNEIAKTEKDIEFRELQINTAIAKGIKEFDAGRYLVKPKKKANTTTQLNRSNV